MRLYLSSYGLGEHPERLVELVDRGPNGRRGLIVLNALNAYDWRPGELERQRRDLAALGLDADELDLREHDATSLDAALAGAGFVWVRGGNVFVLRMAMAASGFDAWIVDALAADRLVYGGFSAGACVLAPSLRGLEHCDPASDAERLYGAVRYDGLGVLDRPVVPHLDTPGHPESELLGEVAARYRRAGQPFHAMRDGEVLVIDD